MRFSLQSIFLLFVLIWSSLAAFGLSGIFVGGLLAVVAIGIREERGCGVRSLVLFSLGSALLVFLLLISSCTTPRECSRQGACINNMKQLLLALHNYYDKYGAFPPAYVADTEGKPMHSWRVLILPQLEYQAEYDKYDFSQPWDSPANQQIATKAPREFRCPSDNTTDSVCTNYAVVVGPEGAWAGDTPRSLDEFGGHAGRTICLVEITNSDIHWMEPRDLSFEEAMTGIHPAGERGISSPHVRDNGYFYHSEPGVHVALADGSVYFVPAATPRETLEEMLTIGGPKSFDCQAVSWPARRLRWDRIAALAAMVVSFLLLVMRLRRDKNREARHPDPTGINPAKPDVGETARP